jgi:hypothetical protein
MTTHEPTHCIFLKWAYSHIAEATQSSNLKWPKRVPKPTHYSIMNFGPYLHLNPYIGLTLHTEMGFEPYANLHNLAI